MKKVRERQSRTMMLFSDTRQYEIFDVGTKQFQTIFDLDDQRWYEGIKNKLKLVFNRMTCGFEGLFDSFIHL